MRCLPSLSQIRHCFSGETHSASLAPQSPGQTQSGTAASHVVHDALYQQLDHVKPYPKPIRSGVARVVEPSEKRSVMSGPPTSARRAARPSRGHNPSPAAREVAAFFAAPAVGSSSLSIHTVLKFDNGALESNHQYIQWLFPTDEASRFNAQAPIVCGEEILILRKNRKVEEGLDAGLAKMMDFYGLKAGADRISIRSRQEGRVRQWLQPGSHHCLRMTRILRSLSLFGKQQQANRLLEFLQHAVRQMPPALREQMRGSLEHWQRAINKPTALSAAGKPCTALLFPAKQLSEPLTLVQPGLQDAPVKAALFKKQQKLYASLAPEQVAAPLIGYFSKPDFVAHYRRGQHFSEQVGDHAQRCLVAVLRDYYFASALTSSRPSSENDTYKVHVDFANQAFGGAWRQAHGFAQEEVAFLENTGLAAIAQHAAQLERSRHASDIIMDSRRRFGAAFSTRIDETPSPILVQGCTRVAEFNSYGSEATRLSKENALNVLMPVEPETTNWLAIAAPDLRHQAANAAPTANQFDDLFSTAHAGFSLSRAIAEGKTLELHTGQFGCGVFRNDVTLSTAAQLLAAKLAGVDQVHFHGYRTDPESAERFKVVRATVEGCIAESLNKTPRESVRMLVSRVFHAVEAIRHGSEIPHGAAKPRRK